MMSSRLRVRLKRLRPHAIAPTRATRASVGYDLHTVDEHWVPPHEVRVLPTGWALEQPTPFDLIGQRAVEIQVRPRSSLFLKRGLLIPNSPGTIDPDFVGHEIGVIVYNPGNQAVLVPAGAAIAQLVFNQVLLPETVEVLDDGQELTDDDPPMTERVGGYGSTR